MADVRSAPGYGHSASRDHWQLDVRWASGVVEKLLVGNTLRPGSAERLAGIGVDVVVREVAARNVDADAMALHEQVARCLEL